MRYIYITIIISVFTINAGAILNGAWMNAGVAPYTSPYSAYGVISAEVEVIFEDGETYRGPVIIYEQGLHVVYGDNQRDYIKLEPGLVIEKKGRSRVKFILPDGDIIVGEAASKINGQRLFVRENAPYPHRSFVLIFSDKYNYEPDIIRIKSLKIESIAESTGNIESNTLFE